MPRPVGPAPEPCILLVDKTQGMTSHDVVARARRAFGTRKVGHAGTLDPMATGLLVLGIEGGTRLLTYIVGLDKTYLATIRLGESTDTDDAEGTSIARSAPEEVDALEDVRIRAGIADLTGEIEQTPSTVSAIKVGGRRAYDLARAGEEVVLAARPVTVSRFEVTGIRRGGGLIDLDVVVDCSSGTYIRALARDLGAALGVGGHLTALRRTRVGSFEVTGAPEPDGLVGAPTLAPAVAAAAVMPRWDVSADIARDLRHGKRIAHAATAFDGVRAAAVDPHGSLIGIVERRGDDVKSVMNLPEPAAPEAKG